jgi:hypothetical protein
MIGTFTDQAIAATFVGVFAIASSTVFHGLNEPTVNRMNCS